MLLNLLDLVADQLLDQLGVENRKRREAGKPGKQNRRRRRTEMVTVEADCLLILLPRL